MSKKQDWVEAVAKKARESNLLIVTMKYCAGCEDYSKLISKSAVINAKARIGEEWFSGFIIFLCTECGANTPPAEELLAKIQWLSKTGSASLIPPK